MSLTPNSQIPNRITVADMVTTRGGTETPGAPAPTPRSSTRKTAGKRELEALETPTQAKRQRKAAAPKASQKKATEKSDAPTEEPLRESVDDLAAPTTENLQTPTVAVSRASPDASSTTEGKDDEAPAFHDAVFYTPAQRAGSVYETPATHRQAEGSPTPKAKPATNEPTSTSTKRGRGRPRKTPQKASSPSPVLETPSKFNDEVPTSSYESSMAPIPSQDIPTSAQPEKTHMHFDDNESVVTQISPVASKNREAPSTTEPEAEPAQDDEDASDSDDEAPEVVTTAAASSKAKATQADADRAQKAQQAKEEAKRQARKEFIAAQQAAKRDREEKKAKKLAKKAAKEAKAAAIPEEEEEEAQDEPRLAIDVSNGLLPASLLDTIDDQRPPTPPPERRGKTEEELRKEKLNHHIKFLERTDKSTKDVKKGKLNVAMLAKQNKVLPPKFNRNTKNVREHWLKGRMADKKKGGRPNARFGKMERRPVVNRGFLRNGDD
ncbi:u3 snorna associated [Pyrenophora seminiperda CCB06]|uniref:U3 snorna associated n=1 Tax=Pyrenophora seminiperda CCB06 TaxID=1302712 RepID=A0A3M7M082_9PLEO|nr:u3 snorna associated [Pyrenophora seminiperda CCB06]